MSLPSLLTESLRPAGRLVALLRSGPDAIPMSSGISGSAQVPPSEEAEKIEEDESLEGGRFEL